MPTISARTQIVYCLEHIVTKDHVFYRFLEVKQAPEIKRTPTHLKTNNKFLSKSKRKLLPRDTIGQSLTCSL